MAINLWEQGGKPNSYTSLPTVNSLLIELNKDYTFTFKAKSPTNAILRVSSYNTVNDLNENITLGNEFAEYSLSWYESQGGQLFFIDKDGAGNIEVKDVKLVEKPMGVSTIKAISENLSDWREHSANIGWQLMTDPSRITLKKRIPVEPLSFKYCMSVAPGYEMYFRYYTNETTDAVANEGWLSANWNKPLLIPLTARFVGIILKRVDNQIITVQELLKMKPMFHIGLSSIPYEKKQGDRMVPPQPTEKNIFDIKDFAINKIQGTGSTYRYDMIVKPNTEYTLSTNAPFDVSGSANIYFNGTSTGIDGVQSGSPKTARSGGKGELYILVRYATNNAYQKVLDGEYLIQIEEGTQATPFEVQRNKVAIVGGTIGKNMFRGFESGYLNSGTFNEKPLSGSNGQRTSLWMECEPGMKYALSGGDRSSWHFKNANGVIFAGLVGSDFGGVITPPNGAVLMRVYYSSDGTHGFPQIEKNEVTNYEKPVTAPKVAIKIPKKNMVKEDTVIMDATVTANVIHDETIKLEIGKTYTLSAIIPTGVTMQPRKEYTGGVYQNLNGNGSRQSLTFVATHEILVLRKYTVSPIGLVTVSEIQVEEGYQTSFEKYIPVNKNIISSRIGKNKVDSIQKWSGTWLNSTVQRIVDGVRLVLDTSKQSQSAINSNNFTFPIVAGNKYTISFDVRGSREGSFPNYTYIMKGANGGGNKSLSSLFNPVKSEWTRQSLTFIAENTVNDAYLMVGFSTNATTGTTNGDSMDFKNVQFEEGELTEYESYRFKPNLAKR